LVMLVSLPLSPQERKLLPRSLVTAERAVIPVRPVVLLAELPRMETLTTLVILHRSLLLERRQMALALMARPLIGEALRPAEQLLTAATALLERPLEQAAAGAVQLAGELQLVELALPES